MLIDEPSDALHGAAIATAVFSGITGDALRTVLLNAQADTSRAALIAARRPENHSGESHGELPVRTTSLERAVSALRAKMLAEFAAF